MKMTRKMRTFCVLLLGTICCVTQMLASDAESTPGGSPGSPVAGAEQPVVVVNGRPVMMSLLDAHVAATGMSREDALEDLIDIQLLRTAAAANGIKAPEGGWNVEERAGIELALARALSLELPQNPVMLVVDHAWLKDAEDGQGRVEGVEMMVRLRTIVQGGASIPEAFTRLQVDGSAWHIGNQEEYQYEVVPAEIRDLPSGSLSRIIPGDGGLHLFKIFRRKQDPPGSDIVHSFVRAQLRQDATIDKP